MKIEKNMVSGTSARAMRGVRFDEDEVNYGGNPPRHNSCRPNRTKNLGAAMKDRSWHDTDKHSRTGRLLGCCRLKARLWNWLPGRLALEQKHYSVGAMMFSPCPPEGGHGLRRRVCRL